MHDPYDFPPAMDPVSSRRALDPRDLDDGFVADEHLAALVSAGLASIEGSIVTGQAGRRYATEPAVRVLGILGRETDPFGYIGRVEPLRALLKRGFVMSLERIALGRIVYAVEYGVVCQPIAGRSDVAVMGA